MEREEEEEGVRGGRATGRDHKDDKTGTKSSRKDDDRSKKPSEKSLRQRSGRVTGDSKSRNRYDDSGFTFGDDSDSSRDPRTSRSVSENSSSSDGSKTSRPSGSADSHSSISRGESDSSREDKNDRGDADSGFAIHRDNLSDSDWSTSCLFKVIGVVAVIVLVFACCWYFDIIGPGNNMGRGDGTMNSQGKS